MSINLTKISETQSKITLGWTPVPGCIGYVFYADDKRVSNTWDPLRSSVTFSKGPAKFRVDAIGVEDTGVYPPVTTPPPTGLGRGIGYLALSASRHPPTNPEKYDTVFLGGSGFPWPHPNKVGVYRSGTNVPDAGWDNGVPIAEARANGWILKDANGQEIYNKGYTYSKLADVGNPDYRLRWCQSSEAYFKTIGADGFYSDDTLAFYSMWWNTVPPKYPTEQAWNDVMIGFCKYIYEYFQPKGFYVAHNAGDWKNGDPESNNGMRKARWWAKVGPYTDGLMSEGHMFLKSFSLPVRKVGPEWYNNWDAYRGLHRLCNGEPYPVTGGTVQIARPVDFIGLDHGTGAERAQQTYCHASFLLDYKEPGSVFIWWADDTSDPWSADYSKLPMGAAQGDATKSGNVWTRRFANGTVTVDPVAGTASIV